MKQTNLRAWVHGNVIISNEEKIMDLYGLTADHKTEQKIKNRITAAARNNEERDAQKGIKHTISYRDFLSIAAKDKTCQLCSYPMEFNVDQVKWKQECQLTFDAVDSTKGHTAGNVVCMHKCCNSMKGIKPIERAREDVLATITAARKCIEQYEDLALKVKDWADASGYAFDWACFVILHSTSLFNQDLFVAYLAEHFDEYDDKRQLAYAFRSNVDEQFRLRKRQEEEELERLKQAELEKQAEAAALTLKLKEIFGEAKAVKKCVCLKINGKRCSRAARFGSSCYQHAEKKMKLMSDFA